MDTFLKAVGAVVVGIALIALVAVVMAYPTKWIINYLVSARALTFFFGAPSLTVWKAMALNYVAGALFKGSCTSHK